MDVSALLVNNLTQLRDYCMTRIQYCSNERDNLLINLVQINMNDVGPVLWVPLFEEFKCVYCTTTLYFV